jgi:glutathione peroxidase
MKIFTVLAALFLTQPLFASASSLYELKLMNVDGKEVTLADYKGKALLIVNVASKCGYTKQYAGLEALYQKYKDQGLVVLGFPCNQFGGQEPGTNEEIKEFCSSKFNVTFPLFDKIDVNGKNRAPLYILLAGKDSPFPGDIKWNFNKFLIGRDGKILQRYESKVTPESPELIAAIESALAAK